MNGLLQIAFAPYNAVGTLRAAAAISLVLLSLTVHANEEQADAMSPREVIQGRIAFMQCSACHAVAEEDGTGKLGPSLAGIFGRKAGSDPGYSNYSTALLKADIVWNPETISQFLADPSGFAPGNLMAFPGIEDADQRALLVRYLRHLTGGDH